MALDSKNILEVKNIEVVYDNVILALHNVSLIVPRGKIVALLGANGAGKSTTLKSISTMLASERGKVTKGSINYEGNEIKNQTPSEMVGFGMVQVLEGRRCFGHLTVEENIIAGAYSRKLSRGDLNQELEKIYSYFKRLKERRKSQAGFTSGGEQQMLAIARILRTGAKLLLLDEISEGLAPVIVQALSRMIHTLREKNFTIVMIEQNFRFASGLADRFYVMEHGRIVHGFEAAQLQANMPMLNEFLGI